MAPLILLVALACKGPGAAPAPTAAHLTVHFLDQDAVCGVDRPRPGVWAFMDAGLWRDLDTVWTGSEGRAVLGRTAPRWVLLKDPEGEVHRVVLSNEPDRLEPGQPSDRDSAEDQAEGLFITWLWLSQVFIRH
ncbi:MAG TPA: hypothetical protein VL181_01495 [Holophagaceae bacterium]|jgi:hypothetical protein|nr:hypothetical protein [Holophagaceae bacterium]